MSMSTLTEPTPVAHWIPEAIRQLRADFPALRRRINGHPLAYLDNTAATLKPQMVIDALAHFYSHHPANVHRGIHQLSEESTGEYEAARAKLARFIGAVRTEEVIFVRNTTEGINLVAQSWGLENLKPGDEILLTVMEHHGNLVPWQQVAKRTGAGCVFAGLTPDGQLDLDDWHDKLNPRTKVVSFALVSNVLGCVQPCRELAGAAHGVGAIVVVDAAQGVPHMPVNVQELACDFLACSAYKMLAPFGIGALWGRYDLLDRMPPYNTGGGMIAQVRLEGTEFAGLPERFEAGTPSVGDVVAWGAAIDYLEAIGMERLAQREAELSKYLYERLAEFPGLRLLSQYQPGKPAIASFTLDYAHPHDVSQILNETGVAVRAGHHCAEPLHAQLGIVGSTRASLYVYNTEAEIDQLISALATVQEFFG
jgi:cysteine desulfurase/selenocysteine lyase